MKSIFLILTCLLSLSALATEGCDYSIGHADSTKVLNTKDMEYYQIVTQYSSGTYMLRNEQGSLSESEWTCQYLAYTDFTIDGLTNGDFVTINNRAATIVALAPFKFKEQSVFYVKYVGDEQVSDMAWTRGNIFK